MFQFTAGKKERETCYVTHGTLGHLDAAQPPAKRKPYATILAVPYVHKAELILPRALYASIENDIGCLATPAYARVVLPLAALLEGEFFTEYVKRGDVLMLSEGMHGVDDVYALRDGVLTLSLGKESYERAGLAGTPEGARGKRGGRWVVRIDLRLPGMLHGRKGFDRVVHAFKSVLSEPVTWLFCNVGDEAPFPDPLDRYFPVRVSCAPRITEGPTVSVPDLKPPTTTGEEADVDDFGEFATDLYEWLALVSLESPRVEAEDRIDPFLSRYTPPAPAAGGEEGQTELVKITWEGFLPPAWAYKTFVSTVMAATTKSWFSFAVSGFPDSLPAGSRECTILKIPGPASEYVLWEVEQN